MTIFQEGSMSPELYSDSEEDGTESEELTDEYETYEDDDEYYDETEGSEIEEDYDDHGSNATLSDTGGSDEPHHKVSPLYMHLYLSLSFFLGFVYTSE